MVKEIDETNQKIYQCEECGFHYPDRAVALRCEEWCKVHKSCNLEITSQALENQQNQKAGE